MRLLLAVILLFVAYSGDAQNCPDSCEIYVPNTVTPDCDDFNCGFLEVHSSCSLNDFNIKIFNRWGELLFESDDPENKFDSGPKEIQDGTYFWKIEAVFCNGKEFEGDGYFHVLR